MDQHTLHVYIFEGINYIRTKTFLVYLKRDTDFVMFMYNKNKNKLSLKVKVNVLMWARKGVNIKLGGWGGVCSIQ